MNRDWVGALKPLLLGFGLGSCILLMMAVTFFLSRSVTTLAPMQSTTPTFTSRPTKTPTLIPNVPSSDNPTVEEILMDAENSILAGNPQDAEEILLPNIETWTSLEDKAQGYKLLGDAEVYKGHFKLAVPYYEKAYFYQPTADNLFTVAITEDMGGELCKALKHYQELNVWEDPNSTFDKDLVQARIETISCILGTKSP